MSYFDNLIALLKVREDYQALQGLHYLLSNPEQIILLAKAQGLKIHTLEAICCRAYMEIIHADTFKIH